MEIKGARLVLTRPVFALLLVVCAVGIYLHPMIKGKKITILERNKFALYDYYLNERMRYSERFKRFSPPESAVVLIAADNESRSKTHRDIIHEDKSFAKTIENIARCNPKVIVLDTVLSDRYDHTEIAKAVKDAGNVIFGYPSTLLSINDVDSSVVEASLNWGGVELPICTSDNTTRYFRHCIFPQRDLTMKHPMVIAVFLAYKNIPLNDFSEYTPFTREDRVIFSAAGKALMTLPMNKEQETLINYRYDEKNIPTIPIWKVFEDDFDKTLLKDKIALIAATASYYHDMHMTPFGIRPGGIILVNVMNSLVHADFIKETPAGINFLILTLLSIILGIWFYRSNPFQGFIILIATILLSFAISILLFLYRNILWVPVDVIVVSVIIYAVLLYFKAQALYIQHHG